MSLTKKIAHNTIAQITGKIISTLLGLVTIGLMTRYLGVEKFGWYITTIAFLQFVGIMTDFGTTVVTAQMLSEPIHDKNKLFKNLFTFRFITAFVFFALAPAAAIFFPYPSQVKLAILIAALSFFTTQINQVFVGLFQTKLKMHIYAATEVFGRIVLIAGIWFFIRADAGFLPIIGAIVLSSVAQTLLIWHTAKQETEIGFAFDKKILTDIIKKMWPIAISIVFNVVYLKGDLVLLSLFTSQTAVGIYGAAYRILDVIAQSAMMIMGTLLPLLAFAWSRGQKEEFKKHYQRSFDIMMLFAVPMVFGTISLSKPIMHFVAGDEFISAGKILSILSIAVFGVFLGAVFGHTAVAIGRQKETLWIYISDAIITLIGYLIFIPLYGLMGAAWMSVFSEIYAGILLFLTINHYAKEKLQIKNLFKIFFASFIMYCTLSLTTNINLFINIILGTAVYGSVIMLTKTVSPATIKEVFGHQQNTVN